MAKQRGNKNIAEAGKATQFPNNDPTLGGRKPSIRNQLRESIEKDGSMIIPASQIMELLPNGDMKIKIPTQDAIVMKLISWAMSKNSTASMSAIQMITEQIDGKPKQQVENVGKSPIIVNGENAAEYISQMQNPDD